MKKHWFKAKRYGWGWYPATVEGWLSIAIFLIAVTASGVLLQRYTRTEKEFITLFILSVFIQSAILVFVSFRTGEKPGWRWGNKPKDE